jgi:hypothetical protein
MGERREEVEEEKKPKMRRLCTHCLLGVSSKKSFIICEERGVVTTTLKRTDIYTRHVVFLAKSS